MAAIQWTPESEEWSPVSTWVTNRGYVCTVPALTGATASEFQIGRHGQGWLRVQPGDWICCEDSSGEISIMSEQYRP